jgi:hypothetical protein
MITPAIAAKRGIKRHCQSEPCGLPFYDLNRAPIECPNCGEGYTPAPEVVYKAKEYGKRPQYKLFKPVEVAEPEEKEAGDGDDALDATTDDGDEIDKVDTLLEIDEDDSDEPIAPGLPQGETE